METHKIGNLTIVRIGRVQFGISYKTTVAVKVGSRYYVDKTKYSNTTQRHKSRIISFWGVEDNVQMVTGSKLSNIIDDIEIAVNIHAGDH